MDEDTAITEAYYKKKRRLKVSDLVIAVLLIIVCILVYPKLFQINQLDDLQDEKGMISVAVMPFENMTGDSLYNVWEGGFQNLMISELSNSSELQVRQYMTMSTILGQKKNVTQASVTPTLAREVALNLETRTFIMGKILKAGEKIRINAQLINSETEEVYKTFQVDFPSGSDLFAMSDSLAISIQNYLEIQKLAEAFLYYIRSYETFKTGYPKYDRMA